MRIVVTQNITLEGRIEMIGDWFDPTDQDAELATFLGELSAREEVLLLGRRTFTDLRGFWPAFTEDTTGVHEQLNTVEKQVISSTLTDPEWENTPVIDPDPIARVHALRERAGGETVVTGSIRLCHALAAEGLVDEYRLFTFPVWQGEGRGLFPDDDVERRLRPLQSRTFTNGVVYTAYEPADRRR